MNVSINDLMQNYSGEGTVKTITVRPARREPVMFLQKVEAVEGRGLKGDRYNSKGGSRQVTLIQQEHLNAVASFLHQTAIDPASTRRNIVVEGINLLALKGKKFQIGTAVFEYSGECHPCSRMEENLGTGGYNAMRGHGGITARIIQSGSIHVGDPISVLL
jgi:MOSC domain-containing protein YiiM